jgi:hypothetical protein
MRLTSHEASPPSPCHHSFEAEALAGLLLSTIFERFVLFYSFSSRKLMLGE